jgi:hypothetical protein
LVAAVQPAASPFVSDIVPKWTKVSKTLPGGGGRTAGRFVAGITDDQRRDLMHRMHLAVKPKLAA